MVTVVGNNITITIGGVDYTNKITSFVESGGDKIQRNVKTYGNNYKSIIVGRTDYKLDLIFKFDDDLEGTLFGDDDTDSVSIVISTGVETITYENMVNIKYNYIVSPEGVGTIGITYSAPANSDGDYNRSVVAV